MKDTDKNYNDILQKLDIDMINYDRYLRTKERELNRLKISIKTGSGKSSEVIKLFNKYMKLRGYEPLSVRKYLKKPDKYERIISPVMYEIDCTIFYCRDVFGIELEKKEAVTIACKEFVQFYEEGNYKLDILEDMYPDLVIALEKLYMFNINQIEDSIRILVEIDADVPRILSFIKYFLEKNYAKNQKRTALKEAIQMISPAINNKFILNSIAINALP